MEKDKESRLNQLQELHALILAWSFACCIDVFNKKKPLLFFSLY